MLLCDVYYGARIWYFLSAMALTLPKVPPYDISGTALAYAAMRCAVLSWRMLPCDVYYGARV
eukprot:3941589-Rhodomonas_salina.3